MSNWFSMGRQDGGPSWYEDSVAEIFHENKIAFLSIIVVVAFSAVLIFCISLYRKDRVVPTLKLFLCGCSGVLLLPTMLTSSWSEAQKNVIFQSGPNEMPLKTKIGIKGGLWKVNIYMECPGALYPECYSKEDLFLGNKEILHRQHLSALNDGWAWPLLFITSLLGGERLSWDGLLGECLYKASCAAEPFLIGSVYLWVLWCVSYKVSPCNSPYMMAFFGLSLMGSAGTYSYVIFTSCPNSILPDGQKLSMEIGWSGQLIAGLGTCLCVLALCIKFTASPSRSKSKGKIIIKDSTRGSGIGNTDKSKTSTAKNFNSSSLSKAKWMENGKREICTKGEQTDSTPPYDDWNVKPLSPTALSQMFVK